ncbi:unnamed protein product [Effrenium voratum]|uniref:Uncharacterized protein n=1 Tax=Effrenium voratum TaxID=2562239 RepID=A0AA36JG93_9DINO|nr:unnamed protein product [Effrenium voratum]CAJ1404805.1 unnamed protein product [Effrenium voratum]
MWGPMWQQFATLGLCCAISCPEAPGPGLRAKNLCVHDILQEALDERPLGGAEQAFKARQSLERGPLRFTRRGGPLKQLELYPSHRPWTASCAGLPLGALGEPACIQSPGSRTAPH